MSFRLYISIKYFTAMTITLHDNIFEEINKDTNKHIGGVSTNYLHHLVEQEGGRKAGAFSNKNKTTRNDMRQNI